MCVWVCVCMRVSECDREITVTRRPWPTKCSCAMLLGGVNVSTVLYGKLSNFTVCIWDN